MRTRGKEAKVGDLPFSLRLDAANAQVWQGEQLLTLTPKAFIVLRYLNDHAGQLVTKDELMRNVWADTVVTDGALVACIRELRKALHDDAHHPQYIETVHRRGYRFLPASITHSVASSQEEENQKSKGKNRRPSPSPSPPTSNPSPSGS
jgi:DNA-binding winged helix-turn-helix (wHTH) protein